MLTTARTDDAPAKIDTGERQSSLKYIPALDGVRGLAMIFVIFCHWIQSSLTLPIHGYLRTIGIPLAYVGHTGVDIFFVLSGFLITRILLSARSQPGGIKNFLWRRSLKIFPLYYLVLTLVLVLTPADIRHNQLRMNAHDTGLVWIWFYGQNFADIFYHDWLYGALDHFWSLSCEEHFYWLWPLAVVFCRDKRKLAAICVSLMAVSIASRSWFFFVAHDGVAPELLTFCRLDGFACGGLLALAEAGKLLNGKLTAWLLGLFVVGVTASVGVHYDMLGPSGCALLNTIEAIIFGALIGLTIIHKDGWLGRFFSNPVLTFFGMYSYGIYVFHHMLRPPLIPVTLFFSANKPNDAAVSYGILHLSLSLSLALLSYHLYEKHFLKLKSRFPTTGASP